MATQSIKDVDLKGKRLFIRVDFNVPLKGGVIKDDTRIRASLPTIKYAIEQGAGLIRLASHLGRPKGGPNPEMSLRPVAARLAELLGSPVAFAEDCVGPAVAARRHVRRGAAREPPLPPGGREERRRLREAAGRGRRRLRQRRVRVGAPRPRVDGRHRRPRAGGRGRPADGRRSGVSGQGAARPGPPVRGDHRRRQGVGQARGDREPARQGRRALHRRGDGLHVPEVARRRGRQVAGRGRSARQGAGTSRRARRRRRSRWRCRPITSSRRSSKPARRRSCWR